MDPRPSPGGFSEQQIHPSPTPSERQDEETWEIESETSVPERNGQQIQAASSVTVGTHAQLASAISGTPSGSTRIITLSAGFQMSGQLTINNNRRIILNGNGRTLTAATTGRQRHFIVSGAGSCLTLNNIILDGGWTSGTIERGGVYIHSGGNLSMNQDSTIRRCFWNNAHMGAAVHLGGWNSTFHMNTRSSITDNRNDATARSWASGGVRISAGRFTMYGGTISGNRARAPGSAGGVQVVDAATFHMRAGTISDNHSVQGGGVHVSNGSLFLLSGTGTRTISRNTASSDGGGVFVSANSRMEVSGGPGVSFQNNRAEFNGGAIFTESYQYASPLGTAAYRNIREMRAVAFIGNQSWSASPPPSNATTIIPTTGFTRVSIHNHPLNNHDINYRIPFRLNYEVLLNSSVSHTAVLGDLDSVKPAFRNTFGIYLQRQGTRRENELNQRPGCRLPHTERCNPLCGSLSRCRDWHHRSGDRLVFNVNPGSRNLAVFRFVDYIICSYQGNGHHIEALGLANRLLGNDTVVTTRSEGLTRAVIAHEISHLFGADCSLPCTSTFCVMRLGSDVHLLWCTRCSAEIMRGRNQR